MGDDRESVEILTAEEVAELLQLNIDNVRKLSREGTLPAHLLPGGRTFRYFRDETVDWLRSQPVGGETETTEPGGATRQTK